MKIPTIVYGLMFSRYSYDITVLSLLQKKCHLSAEVAASLAMQLVKKTVAMEVLFLYSVRGKIYCSSYCPHMPFLCEKFTLSRYVLIRGKLTTSSNIFIKIRAKQK